MCSSAREGSAARWLVVYAIMKNLGPRAEAFEWQELMGSPAMAGTHLETKESTR